MKRILVDGDLILQGLRGTSPCLKEFDALWNLLQSSQVQGYVSRVDLARLQRQLKAEIGDASGTSLVNALRRVLQVYPERDRPLLHAVLTDSPQNYSEWEIPTLTITEFLQRYELECLLELTVKSTLDPVETAIQSDRQFSTAMLSTLLVVPLLLKLWMEREKVMEKVTALLDNRKADSSETAIATRPDGQNTLTGDSFSPTLLVSAIPGVEISLANDSSFTIRLDEAGNAVSILLAVAEAAANPDQPAAIIRRTDTGTTVAEVVRSAEGIVLAESHASASSLMLSDSAASAKAVAMVHRTGDGRLVAMLNGGASVLSANQVSNTAPQTALITVRYTDGSGPDTPSPTEGAIEIRFQLERNGLHQMTLRSLPESSDESLPANKTIAGLPSNSESPDRVKELAPDIKDIANNIADDMFGSWSNPTAENDPKQPIASGESSRNPADPFNAELIPTNDALMIVDSSSTIVPPTSESTAVSVIVGIAETSTLDNLTGISADHAILVHSPTDDSLLRNGDRVAAVQKTHSNPGLVSINIWVEPTSLGATAIPADAALFVAPSDAVTPLVPSVPSHALSNI